MRFQRARKPEEKEVRRQAILTAARALAREVGPIELGLNELGRRSGVSKPNIYRYFESREEVLLRLFVAELADCAEELESSLASCRPGVRAVGQRLVKAYLARPLLCQLLGIVASVLEHNLSVEAVAGAKREIHASIGRAAAALAGALPWLSRADAAWTIQAIALYVAGMWPAAHPSSVAAQVLRRAEFAALRPDPERDLARCVELLLAGLDSRRSARR